MACFQSHAQITNNTGLLGEDLIFYEDSNGAFRDPNGMTITDVLGNANVKRDNLSPTNGSSGELKYSRPSATYPNGNSNVTPKSYKLTGNNDDSTNLTTDVWLVVNSIDLSDYDGGSKYFTFSTLTSFREDGSTNLETDVDILYTTNFITGSNPTDEGINWASFTPEQITPVDDSAEFGTDGLWTTQQINLSSISSGSNFAIAFRRQTSENGPNPSETNFSGSNNRNGAFYIADLAYTGSKPKIHIATGEFSALNTSATGQTNIFETPTAAIDYTNFTNSGSNNAKWAGLFTSETSVPRLAEQVIPINEGYKFKVSDNYNPVVVTEITYRLANSAENKGEVEGVSERSTWKFQGSNNDIDWDDITIEQKIFGVNNPTDRVLDVKSSKPYRYFRFVLAVAWQPTQKFTALQQINFTVAALWQGNTDNNWSTTSNWNNESIPTNEVIIPSGLNNYPTITSGNLTTTNIRMLSGSSFISDVAVPGNVIYYRNLTVPTPGNSEGWHLVSAPVSGETYNTDWANSNGIAFGNSPNRAIATYNNAVASNNWVYSDGTTANFNTGVGYSLKRTNTGDVSFNGTMNTSNISNVAITSNVSNYNLVGNPFTAYINSKTFLELASNSNILESEAIWIWNPLTKNYEVKMSGDETPFKIAPGQAFFVKASSNGNLTFNTDIRSHESTDTFFKGESSPKFTLNIVADDIERYTKVRYLNNVTKSFDNGYDGETFTGSTNLLDIYTRLIENDEYKKFQVQSIPNKDYENMVIPIDLVSSTKREVTFSLNASNIPSGYNIYLEDRTNNIVTLLSDSNASYKTMINESETNGQFFIHMKTSSVLSTNETLLNSIRIYNKRNNTLQINGLTGGKAVISIFNLLGSKVFSSSFEASTSNSVNVPNLSKGVYVVKLKTMDGELNKKIIFE